MRFWILCISLLLTSCLLGPNYRSPEPCISDAWTSDPCCAGTPEPAWWELFNDPLLTRYIALAAERNLDVQIAVANLFQARAIRQTAASTLFPWITGNVSAVRDYFSKNGPVFDFGTVFNNTGLPFTIQIPQKQNIFTALLNVSWEIDLFGKTRRGVEAAQANLESTLENRNAVLISVLAEVARNYIDLRSAQSLGMLIEENLDLLEKQVALVSEQWEKGYVDRLRLETVEAQFAQLKATLPPICAQIYQYAYALAQLTGFLPEDLLVELLPIAPLPEPPSMVGCGLRSDLLRRRPDVREAERQLAAATANIGVAVASFFPSFTFSPSFGLQSILFRNWLELPSNMWIMGGSASIPLFEGGYLIGNLHLSEAQAVSAALYFQQMVLRALQEAETALIVYNQDRQSMLDQKSAVEHFAAFDSLTKKQFEAGYVSLTNVIESGRELNTAEQNLLQNETAVLLDLVNLYKALGGGWECFPIQ